MIAAALRQGTTPFLVDDVTFDHVLQGAVELEPDFGSGPAGGWDPTINHLNAARGCMCRTRTVTTTSSSPPQ
jgi:hypothetical protein